MANLTGEYDIAAEVSVGLVNTILAAIHENRDEEYPRFPHSETIRVEDVHQGPGDPVPETQRTGVRTTAEVQLSTPTVSFPVEGLAEPIWSPTRAPVSAAIAARLGPAAEIGPIGPISPGGKPTCWPKVGVRLRVRAWLRDTPEELPEFLHGDLSLTTGLVRSEVGGRTFLGLDHRSGPEVRFEPAAGTALTGEQRSLVERIVRNFIRGESEPASFELDLPADVRRFDYKLQPAGPRQSAMLMLTLGDRPPGPKGPRSIGASFLPSGADFAAAVGRDFLVSLFRRVLLSGLPAEFTASGTGWSTRVKPDWAGAGFDLQPGRIVLSLSGSGSVTYGGWIFKTTDHWSFTVRQAFTLGVVGGVPKPAMAGDPEVELHDVAVFEGTIRDKAREALRKEIQRNLDHAPPELEDTLDVGSRLEGIIAPLHPGSPGVALTGVEIRPDGVVAAGNVALVPSHPVEVRQVQRSGFADALDSWIPGGTIERLVWDGHVEEHRFVTEPGKFGAFRLRCLTVEGTRVTRGGALAPVSIRSCPIVFPVLPLSAAPSEERRPAGRPLLPLLEIAPDGCAEPLGHYDPWSFGLAPSAGPTNLLLHFAADPWIEAAAALEEALAVGARREAAVVVVGVICADDLAHAAGSGLKGADLLLTDDPTGGWRSAFGVEQGSATVIVGPAAEVRWKEEGKLDPAKLGKALDKHLERGGEVSWQALRLAVSASDPAPDVHLRFDGERELALRRFRGAPVALSFWNSSSEASIEQLRQLRDALDSEDGERPSVLGIGDGESPRQVAELAEREKLPFPLVPDPEREIARRYGVSCWPTTVQVGVGGKIEALGLGLFPGLSLCGPPYHLHPLETQSESDRSLG